MLTKTLELASEARVSAHKPSSQLTSIYMYVCAGECWAKVLEDKYSGEGQ